MLDYTSGSLVVKNYLYINGFVYLNDTLQYVLQEEGRIRYAKKWNSQTGTGYYAFEYDYFLSDHLGNVRTLLTEGRDTATYAATMEPERQATEQALFSNIYDPVNTVYAKPSGFDTESSNQYVSRLNASTTVNKKTGPALVLKVMKGDQVQLNTFAWYNTPTQSPGSGPSLLNELLSTLSTGVVSGSGGKETSVSGVSNAISPSVTQFLDNGRSYDVARPKAYLNWILFDEQFQYVSSNSGVVQVSSSTSKQALIAPLQTIAKSGYLYVYVSNESPQDVYFDDITVKHFTGPLLQEQSYYPFGLQMQGLSSRAFGKLSSQYKFNGGVELEEEINLYSTFYRMYDPQLGRFSGVDIKAEEQFGFSAYHFGFNNPILFNDPIGDLAQATTTNAIDLIKTLLQFNLNTLEINGSSDWNLANFSFDADGGMDGFGLYNADFLNGGGGASGSPFGAMGDIAIAGIRCLANFNSAPSLLVWTKEKGLIADVGHVALRIGGLTFGYYPTDVNRDGTFNKDELFGGPGEMRIYDLATFNKKYNGQEVTEFFMNMNANQINSVLNSLDKWYRDPGQYSLTGNNCTSVALQCLFGAGIKIYYQTARGPMEMKNPFGFAPADISHYLKDGINSHLIINWVTYTVK